MKLGLEETKAPCEIWSAAQISTTKLPPLHTILFGTFQVIDYHIAEADSSAQLQSQRSQDSDMCSYIDVGFGSSRSSFAGLHRFSIRRNRNERSDEGEVEIEMSSLICNPTVDRLSMPAALMIFDRVYARLLFREAVSRILRS